MRPRSAATRRFERLACKAPGFAGGYLLGRVALGKCRLETLAMVITGMISARTVNLSHLASERAGEVSVASTYRRLQRFFQ